MSEKLKDILIGLLIGLFFTVLEMAITYWIVKKHSKKETKLSV